MRRRRGGFVDESVVVAARAAAAGFEQGIPSRRLLRCGCGRAFDGEGEFCVRRCDMSFGACKIGEVLCAPRLLCEQGSEREIGYENGVLGGGGLCVCAERRLDLGEQRAALGKEEGHKGRLRRLESSW